MEKLKQTAVQWLIEQMTQHYFDIAEGRVLFSDLRDQALAMERKQIVDIVDMAREGNFSNYDKLGYVDWAYTKEQITNTYQQP